MIVSIGGSAIGGLPTKLAAQWFEPKEYDIANSLASSAGPFGTILVGLLTPFIVKEPADLSNMQFYFSIPIFLAFIGSLMIRRNGYIIQVNERSFKEQVDAFYVNIPAVFACIRYTGPVILSVLAKVSVTFSFLYLSTYVKTRLWIIFRSENTRYYLLLTGLFIYALAVVRNIGYFFQFCERS